MRDTRWAATQDVIFMDVSNLRTDICANVSAHMIISFANLPPLRIQNGENTPDVQSLTQLMLTEPIMYLIALFVQIPVH